jgi:hypothetical protein
VKIFLIVVMALLGILGAVTSLCGMAAMGEGADYYLRAWWHFLLIVAVDCWIGVAAIGFWRSRVVRRRAIERAMFGLGAVTLLCIAAAHAVERPLGRPSLELSISLLFGAIILFSVAFVLLAARMNSSDKPKN